MAYKTQRRTSIRVTLCLIGLISITLLARNVASEELRIATFNLRNYRQEPAMGRPAKSPAARIAVRRVIQEIAADIIALQEVGRPEALDDFISGASESPWQYRYAAFCQGDDPHNYLATLSRAPITHSVAHNEMSFLLYGRRTMVSRGFLETRIQASPNLELIVINAHLKSKRSSSLGDHATIRRKEAVLLLKLSQKLARDHPSIPQIILGDLNDTPDSVPLRIITQTNHLQFVDLAPMAVSSNSRAKWTYFYSKDDTYSRIDYILVDSRIRDRLVASQTYVLDTFESHIASDHRPVVATLNLSSNH